jgi:hypothetical protein
MLNRKPSRIGQSHTANPLAQEEKKLSGSVLGEAQMEITFDPRTGI